MSATAGQAELHTFSLIKNLHRSVRWSSGTADQSHSAETSIWFLMLIAINRLSGRIRLPAQVEPTPFVDLTRVCRKSLRFSHSSNWIYQFRICYPRVTYVFLIMLGIARADNCRTKRTRRIERHEKGNSHPPYNCSHWSPSLRCKRDDWFFGKDGAGYHEKGHYHKHFLARKDKAGYHENGRYQNHLDR